MEIKLHLTNLPALPPRFERSATALEELALGRECLEQAVLISVQVRHTVPLSLSSLLISLSLHSL